MKIQTKQLGSLLLAAAIAIGGVTASFSELHAASSNSQTAQQTQVTLKWNGKALETKGLLIKGQTLIPIAALRDDLKLPVAYNASEKAYTIGANYNKLTISTGYDEPYVGVNGVSTDDMKAQLINGKLYIPIGNLKVYLGIDAAWNAPAKTVSMTKGQRNEISIRTVNLSQEKMDTATYDLKYPQFAGSQAGVEKMNAVLKQHAEQVLAQAKQQMQEMGGSPANQPSKFESTYVVTYNRGGYVSLIMQDYSYLGSFDGTTSRTGYTFSLADGAQLELGDVLKANPDYKKAMLKKVQDKDGFFRRGLSDHSDFYVTGTGVAIFIQTYEFISDYYFAFTDLLPAGAKPFSG
ncbi:DUF4163 domain-containing protein [Paenibacillus sp. P96]|uniref:DUF4163 domain-containing protein n=1 Tax=Paenibacillus zeirhizosphaerae TaxID=2987519 RepID=A0ABT9FKX1_9BACL|nr:DUF4163 domain-containing protein [Paenibacillus sp. P96]MDP4095372.1 DUF4163 domain-containing protein [Paenibacillus sp. P96]